ncbi:alpha/beta hydrolase fold domain-containing protein [Streptomyces sp. DT24]|uniref:alpha/beta hydrolase fold domain-containing protein n=1 Tax=Streptomyces sp. DT24 TaxID=3416520 RepID=UPI003CF5DF64
MTDQPQYPRGAGWTLPVFIAPTPPVTDESGVRRFDSLTYAATPGYRPCLLDVAVPAAKTPPAVVIWLHGGAWLFGDRRFPPPTVTPEALFGGILSAGLALVRIDYRHSKEAPFPAQLHDAKAAVRYVRHFADTLGVDAERIGVWGESAGGHLAALLGLTPTDDPAHPLEGSVGVTGTSSAVQAVVDWYGVTDVTGLLSTLHRIAPPGTPHVPDPAESLLGDRSEQWPLLARVASPLTYADRPAPPFLIQHGTDDREVPHHHSERLAAALRAAGSEVTLRSVAGADHCFFDLDDITPVVTEGIDFLGHHLS